MKRFLNRKSSVLALLAMLLLSPMSLWAHHTESHFDDRSPHKVVYQLNKADPAYHDHILFSVGTVLRKYGDDVEIVVEVFAEGIHLLAKNPKRPVPEKVQQKVRSLADYGVAFHACENTMKSLQWEQKDMLDFAKVVPSGADDLMLLQERGFSYISW
ncbi:MAG: DsrE family protein [Gammaproteobacteria bacterium]|nr:DsrE family protein [Gammaproteobacteria bacterium]